MIISNVGVIHALIWTADHIDWDLTHARLQVLQAAFFSKNFQNNFRFDSAVNCLLLILCEPSFRESLLSFIVSGSLRITKILSGFMGTLYNSLVEK